MFNINFCQWLDSNRRPLDLEATALSNKWLQAWIDKDAQWLHRVNCLLITPPPNKSINRKFLKILDNFKGKGKQSADTLTYLTNFREMLSVWPDWAIYLILGNFSKPVGTMSLPKYTTFIGNFCKGVKIFHFSSELIFGQLLQTFGNFLLVTLDVIAKRSTYFCQSNL